MFPVLIQWPPVHPKPSFDTYTPIIGPQTSRKPFIATIRMELSTTLKFLLVYLLKALTLSKSLSLLLVGLMHLN